MVSPHHVVKIATALSAVALTASVAAAPAYALQDIAIEDAVAQSGSVTADNGVVMQSDDQSDDQTGDQQSQDSMPDNPNAKLPDNVSDEISDDATVISEDLAATPEGEVKNIETGEIVTDPTLVGTKDQQPDRQNQRRILHSGKCGRCQKCCSRRERTALQIRKQ